ncbi:unnamed protein product [Prorocentrum cordatum]|uniref:Uncharacterized protein n=1 Tax=Prorocentrum cordatum TaxID=2364126 RepID=A0ABN9S1G2_9DINO|nr:unnamed protein product [Polarella glacialis]
MIAETTAAIYAGGFKWKESSLQVKGRGDAVTDTLDNVVCRGREGIMIFTAVDRMLVLGEMIDNHSSTATSMVYILGGMQKAIVLPGAGDPDHQRHLALARGT